MSTPSDHATEAAAAPPPSSFSSEAKPTAKRKIHVVVWIIVMGVLLIGVLVQALLNPPQQRGQKDKRDASGAPRADLSRGPDPATNSEISRQRDEALKARDGKDPESSPKASREATAASTSIRVGPPIDQAVVNTAPPGGVRPASQGDVRAQTAAPVPPQFRDAPVPPGVPPGVVLPAAQISEAQVRAVERDAPEAAVARSPLEGLPGRAGGERDLPEGLPPGFPRGGDDVPAAAAAAAASQGGPGRGVDLSQLANLARGAMGAQRAPAVQRSEANEQFLSSMGEDKAAQVVRAQRAVSPYQLTMGAVIPAALLGELQSDLPGQVLAVVTENIYDSISGSCVVVPKGSRLIGRYSTSIANGQDRLLVAFTRLTFPSGATADLGGMPGADTAGMAGFEDKVNNHFLRQFGASLLVAVIARRFTDERDNIISSTAAGATSSTSSVFGNVLSSTVSRMLDRYTNISPTITIRRGYPFNVVVSKDMALDPSIVSSKACRGR